VSAADDFEMSSRATAERIHCVRGTGLTRKPFNPQLTKRAGRTDLVPLGECDKLGEVSDLFLLSGLFSSTRFPVSATGLMQMSDSHASVLTVCAESYE
jgi:hypothetical protein